MVSFSLIIVGLVEAAALGTGFPPFKAYPKDYSQDYLSSVFAAQMSHESLSLFVTLKQNGPNSLFPVASKFLTEMAPKTIISLSV